jgi:hypothetical protein
LAEKWTCGGKHEMHKCQSCAHYDRRRTKPKVLPQLFSKKKYLKLRLTALI